MKSIIFASNNKGKFREVKHLLGDLPINLESLVGRTDLPRIIEDQETLEGNALKKGRVIFAATGMPTISDDTGLEVFKLNMAPGVLSARYAGENVSYRDNNLKLLKELTVIPEHERGGQFRCIAAFIDGKVEKTFEGICKGTILKHLRGDQGFGYDPLFMPSGYDKTFAELKIEEKNKISHRAIAFLELKKFLIDYYSL